MGDEEGGFGRGRGGDEGGGFGGRGNRGFMPKPVKVGDEIDVEIEAIAAKGDGIAKKDGFVIFVTGANKGDKIKVRIKELKSTFAIGEIVQ
ncbi:hypothetical protein AUJ17_01370 [Candidatus Micrarchaeota archaeon CG1_02_47_40]|nr:MAG: hypothetical protein AUJ17_01370 [Candidatus Micrarchaeota archaeon CG1_02_47_40]